MFKNYISNILVIIIFGITISGMIGIGIPETREFYMAYTPEYLLLLFLILLIYHKPWNRQFITALFIILLFSFFIEIIGVNFGILFGNYSYGEPLGIAIFNTPIIIAVNWVILLYCVYVIGSFLRWHSIFRSLLGAGIIVLYDYIIEPVANKLGWWTWDTGSIPERNYITWFAFAFLVLFFLHINRIKMRNRMALMILSVIFIFFVGLRILLFL